LLVSFAALFRQGFNFSAFSRTMHVVTPSVGMYFTVYEYMKNNVFVIEGVSKFTVPFVSP